MHAIDTESMDLATYRLRDIAVTWYEMWDRSRGPLTPLSEAFLKQYLPIELYRAKKDIFLRLEQGNMSVREYNMPFNSLSKYAPLIVAEMSDRVHRFVDCLGPHLINEFTIASLSRIWTLLVYKLMRRAWRIEKGNSELFESMIGANIKEPNLQPGHIMHFCLMRNVGGVIPPIKSAAAFPSIAYPREQGMQPPMEKGRGKGGMSGPGWQQQNRIYALSGPQNLESSPDVVTSILFVFSLYMYVLIDPSNTLSYIFPLVASKCGKEPEMIRQPFQVSMPMGELVIVRRVYRSCDVMLYDCHTMSDLNELEMV
ncbi:uncharacterized protein [Nicotiana tomentosiformis]|uniref:uncharacterized protein n=1 Tax=Nicotiana tomentosiformis TaxID=4098 RepID=UPI00388CDFCB